MLLTLYWILHSDITTNLLEESRMLPLLPIWQGR
jgi:hypothetical protein